MKTQISGGSFVIVILVQMEKRLLWLLQILAILSLTTSQPNGTEGLQNLIELEETETSKEGIREAIKTLRERLSSLKIKEEPLSGIQITSDDNAPVFLTLNSSLVLNETQNQSEVLSLEEFSRMITERYERETVEEINGTAGIEMEFDEFFDQFELEAVRTLRNGRKRKWARISEVAQEKIITEFLTKVLLDKELEKDEIFLKKFSEFIRQMNKPRPTTLEKRSDLLYLIKVEAQEVLEIIESFGKFQTIDEMIRSTLNLSLEKLVEEVPESSPSQLAFMESIDKKLEEIQDKNKAIMDQIEKLENIQKAGSFKSGCGVCSEEIDSCDFEEYTAEEKVEGNSENIAPVLSLDKGSFRMSLLIDNVVFGFFRNVVPKSFTKAPRFELIYKATVDGFSAKDFHSKCDFQGATLVIIKNNYGFIFGGFTSIPWSSPVPTNSYKDVFDEHAILFSFDQKKVFRQSEPKTSWTVRHDSRFGPLFGVGFDLAISSNCNLNEDSRVSLHNTFNMAGSTAAELIGTGLKKFKVLEYVVYKVIP